MNENELEQLIKTLEAEKNYRAKRNRLKFYKPYPKQMEFHAAGKDYRERLLLASNQSGKAQKHDEPVLTPSGWVQIKDIKVGDDVIAGDGSVTKVTGVYPQGVIPLVEVEFCYGTKVVVSHDHLWKALSPKTRYKTKSLFLNRKAGEKRTSIQIPNDKFGQWDVFSTGEMIERYGHTPSPWSRFAVPATGTVQLAEKPVTVDPYVLGLLLGNGCLINCIMLSVKDAEAVKAFELEAARHDCYIRHTGPGKIDYYASALSGRNQFKNALRDLDLIGKGALEKRVPHNYLWNTPEVRLAILQGLMDTDGTCEKSGQTTYTSISEGLANDVAFLARSFGAKCHIRSRITFFTYKGEKKQGQRSYTVTIRLPHVPLFRLKRKAERYVRPASTTDHHLIVAFREIEPAEAFCISVTHPDRTYVTRDFIVTHNTLGAAAETAIHATQRYPDWWQGKVFNKPVVGWVSGVTGESTRDNPQRLLYGQLGSPGTGMIPADAIHDTASRRGLSDALDTILVKSGGGGDVQAGISQIGLKSYDQGREKWAGPTLDFVWYDEEPPMDIYTEGLTRTNVGMGPIFMTFTPLLGMSEVVRRFVVDKLKGTHVTQMTIEDALHYSAEDRASIIASYAPHEREARTKGVPLMGSGRVFPVSEESIRIEPFAIPEHWTLIGGLDFGYNHPSAAVKLAWDKDNDVLYVVAAHRAREQTPTLFVPSIRPWGNWLPWAWPHDGMIHDKGSGIQLAKQYKDQGLSMLPEHATFPDGTHGFEAGIAEMLDRMQTDRLKIFSNLNLWFEEFRMYHRKEGVIVKVHDDLMAATRYAMMMRRFSKPKVKKGRFADFVAGWQA